VTRANVALAVALLVVGLLYGCEMKARGRAEADGARWRSELAALRGRTARVDSVYVRDTVTLWRQVRSTDTLTQTVETWKHDTVKVVEYVARADSTIRSCTAALLTCEQRVALRDSTIRTLERQWADRPKPPHPFWRWAERAGWLALVVTVAKSP